MTNLNKTEKKTYVFGVLVLIAFLLFTLMLFFPKKTNVFGRYVYYENGKPKEEIVLKIDNTSNFYIYSGEDKIEGLDGRVVRWRMVLNRREQKEYQYNDFEFTSIFQVQLLDSNGSSLFQVFKIDNMTLYSKSKTGVGTQQKCYKKV